MAFYYVKSGGTGTGDLGRATTARTGTFASMGAGNYYPSITAALAATTAPATGDSIYCASDHAHNYGASTTHSYPTTYGIKVVSVDVDNADQYLAGASDSTTTGTLTRNGAAAFYGMTFNSASNQNVGNGYSHDYYSCNLSMDRFTTTTATNRVYFWDSIIGLDVGASSSYMLYRGAVFFMSGGAITTTLSSINRVFDFSYGLAVHLKGTDLSKVANNIFEEGESSGLREWDILLENCQRASGAAITDQVVNTTGQIVRAFNSSDVAAAAEYQFYWSSWGGVAEDQDDSGVHRGETTAFPSGEKTSIKVTTDANASKELPFTFDISARYAELSSASQDVLTIYFAVINTVTLTDTNFWAEVIYPDGTTQNQYNLLSGRNADILATGTTHTDDSGGSTWYSSGTTDLTGYNEYRLELDTSSDPGSDSAVSIRIYVGEPSVSTLYIDPIIGVS